MEVRDPVWFPPGVCETALELIEQYCMLKESLTGTFFVKDEFTQLQIKSLSIDSHADGMSGEVS